MLKKFFIIWASFMLTTFNFLTAEPIPKCAPQLQKHLNAILKIPEAKILAEAIQKEGPIQIIAKRSNQPSKFGAFWDPDRRKIIIELSPNSNDGLIMGSIIFELHNASTNAKFKELNLLAENGFINKEDYIRSMEYLEYINSLNASKIADKGIKSGILPPDAYLHTYSSFKEHFMAQKRSGHSNFFADNFDTCIQSGKNEKPCLL
jgi:hypothetical protein